MRLNLGCGSDIRSHDYLNVDIMPLNGLPSELFRQGDVTTLDWLCADGSVDEILALDVLQCIPHTGIEATLANWVNKLQPGGVLKISIPDLFWIASAFADGMIELSAAVPLLYGAGRNPHDFSRCALDARTLKDLLQARGMNMQAQRQGGYRVYVEAQREGARV